MNNKEQNWKKCKCVLLSTKEHTNIIEYNKEFYNISDLNPSQLANSNYFHIYILSDDEIKAGNYVFHEQYGIGTIESAGRIGVDTTVDWYVLFPSINSKSFIVYNSSIKKIISSTDSSLNLPKPSDDFIKLYCEKGGIDEVMVETDIFGRYIVDSSNEITIKQVKETWTREEVVRLICKAMAEYREYNTVERNLREKAEFTNNWLKENIF